MICGISIKEIKMCNIDNNYEYVHDNLKIFNGEFDIKASQTMVYVKDYKLFEFTNIFDLIINRQKSVLEIKSNMLIALYSEYYKMKEAIYKLSFLYSTTSKKYLAFEEKIEIVFSLIVWWKSNLKSFFEYVLEQDEFQYYMCDDFHAEKIKSFAYSVYRAKLEQCLI